MARGRLSALVLSEAERSDLTSLAARRNTAQALALRARIVLGCAEGRQNKEVAARLGVDKATVGKWRRRFVEQRLDGLRDEPRSGTPRTIDDARIEAVIVRTLESTPPAATHWSSRGMAKARHPPQHRRSPCRDHRLHRPAQRRSQALPLDQIGRRYPCLDRTVLRLQRSHRSIIKSCELLVRDTRGRLNTSAHEPQCQHD